MKNLGLRYERLLFLAAPLSLLALLVLLVTLASGNQQEYFEARCSSIAVEVLKSNEGKLNNFWHKPGNDSSSRKSIEVEYVHQLKLAMIEGLQSDWKCHNLIDRELDFNHAVNPRELLEKWRTRAKQAASTPIQYAGLEIPERALISLFGTTIKIELLVLNQALQIALAPMVLLWLGSLYNTRFRETHLNGVATSITDIFPHMVNVYPVGRFAEIRKKSWMRYHMPKIIFGVSALVRMTLISIFVAPPVIFYIASLVYMRPTEFAPIIYGFGFLLVLYLLLNLVVELAPWHLQKTFPGKYTFN